MENRNQGAPRRFLLYQDFKVKYMPKMVVIVSN